MWGMNNHHFGAVMRPMTVFTFLDTIFFFYFLHVCQISSSSSSSAAILPKVLSRVEILNLYSAFNRSHFSNAFLRDFIKKLSTPNNATFIVHRLPPLSLANVGTLNRAHNRTQVHDETIDTFILALRFPLLVFFSFSPMEFFLFFFFILFSSLLYMLCGVCFIFQPTWKAALERQPVFFFFFVFIEFSAEMRSPLRRGDF